MQYHHIYHAGNFADVFKHCILVMLSEALSKKDKAICYLDTHAGIGRYDLTSELASKTSEYISGISVLYNKTESELKIPTSKNAEKALKNYLRIVHSYNKDAQLKYYPGSPLILQTLMRQQDRLVLVELNKDDVELLRIEFAQKKQIAVHHSNGYQSLKAFLPPKEGRGLILIDPAFEDINEFENIIAALKTAKQKFPTGVYAIWYPIKDLLKIQEFYSELENLNFKNILVSEFSVDTLQENSKLTRCGLAIINSPWKFEEDLQPLLNWLNAALARNNCGYSTSSFIHNS
ncbi:MAG: 23S rRNA (adenine(2030)-N(6))-methyltransferase RlmJ [Gammaproteobacteria bacterium]